MSLSQLGLSSSWSAVFVPISLLSGPSRVFSVVLAGSEWLFSDSVMTLPKLPRCCRKCFRAFPAHDTLLPVESRLPSPPPHPPPLVSLSMPYGGGWGCSPPGPQGQFLPQIQYDWPARLSWLSDWQSITGISYCQRIKTETTTTKQQQHQKTKQKTKNVWTNPDDKAARTANVGATNTSCTCRCWPPRPPHTDPP